MEPYKISTPEGTRDRLFSESIVRRDTQLALTGLFKSRGYSEVITPVLEFYELYVRAQNPISPEIMLKLVDHKGRLLVLRPDCTIPIARIAAARLRDAIFPQRFFYNQTVYRAKETNSGREVELAQCGIELLGADGLKADTEIVANAIDALIAAGALNFHIELGHVDYFTGFMAALNVSSDTAELIRSYLESREFTALEDFCKTDKRYESIMRLPYLFGGTEILDEARSVTDSIAARTAVDYLSAIYSELAAAGKAEFIRFDLSPVHAIDYYSGLVFRGFAEGIGQVVLAGGRYDSLIGDFGFRDIPATGFAVYVDALTAVLTPTPLPAPDTLIHYEYACLGAALAALDSLPHGSAELSHLDSVDASLELARSRSLKRLLIVSPNAVEEVFIRD